MSPLFSTQDLITAQQLLEQGDVVAMPTETVYGLAARIDRPAGLQKIFSIKERPFFDPLIVHVDSVAMAKSCVREWPVAAEALANALWPGPLTMVLPKSERIADVVTSGLDSVGLRIPRHTGALALLAVAGVPLAAPSANKFGRTSPTTWQHVQTEFSGQVFILKADGAEVGIESTVLKIEGKRLTILRPGMLGKADIEKALRAAGLGWVWNESSKKGEAPGQMKHHYMPRIPLVIAPAEMTEAQISTSVQSRRHEIPQQLEGVNLAIATATSFVKPAALELSLDPAVAARLLYSELRRLADAGHDLLYFRRQSWQTGEHWAAILERLTKAASLEL